jgi:dihydroorotase-like cyclic amidohydrolase
MLAIANFVNKYSSSNKSKAIVPYDTIKATEKWLEYALDIVDMQQALMLTKNLNEKFKLMDALEVAERKKAYMYKHKNFDAKRAFHIFNKVKDVSKK